MACTQTKPIAETWFSIDVYDNAILRFREHQIDSFAVGDIWLIRGSEHDLAVDTGSGIVPPAPLLEAVSEKPITAVALNCYYDHAGGWHSFSERACHRLEASELANPDGGSPYGYPYLNESTLWALPRQGFRLADFSMVPAVPTRLVADGDRFELGNRSLEVLHVPGRSCGGLAIWEAVSGSLFTSDMLYDGDHGDAWPPDDPGSYCASLRRLRNLPVKRVYPGHYGTMDRGRMLQLIDEQLADLGQ